MNRFSIEKGHEKVLAALQGSRPQEQIISDLQAELRPVREDSLLIHAMRLIIELDNREESRLYTQINSPMKQSLYLIDLYYSIRDRTNAEDIETRWDKIARLLDEMEMAYFVSIGFPNHGDIFHDANDSKIDIALSSFLNYYSNASLCYEEQTRDKIIRNCKPYDTLIQTHFGFSVDDAIHFILHLRNLNNQKFDSIVRKGYKHYYYLHHPEKWQELVSTFEERGIHPDEWIHQPELEGIHDMFSTNPGEVCLHTREEILAIDMKTDIKESLIRFFLYNPQMALEKKDIYFADKRISEDYPLFALGDRFICPINKFFFEALSARLDRALQKLVPTKYKHNADIAFEKRIENMFRNFFPSKTHFYTSYTIDQTSENDLLIRYGHTWIIVEIKNGSFRAPFRDPLKAYDRIKTDFQKTIQYGYDQCRRVEKALLSGQPISICEAKKPFKTLYQTKPREIEEVWSIIVTDYSYGDIQVNLSKLLTVEEDSLYPWSVSADNLEILLLLMKTRFKGIAPQRFIEYLDYRERFHEHVLCFDELELAGWYLCNRDQFKTYADHTPYIATIPEMAEIFDAYYHTGLGFPDELDIQYKKHYKLKSYPQTFDLEEIDPEQFTL